MSDRVTLILRGVLALLEEEGVAPDLQEEIERELEPPQPDPNQDPGHQNPSADG